MNPLSLLRQFIHGLTKENEPYQIGLGIAFGFWIGLIPKNNLTAQILFILMMFTKANIPFSIITIFIFSLISPLTDIISDPLGYSILNFKYFESFFTTLYNTPIIPWTDFNNTVVMGGLILGFILFFPVYLAGKKFGIYYNSGLKEKILKLKFIKALKTSWLFDWYFKI